MKICPKELTVRLSNTDKRYLNLAINLAEQSECRFRHAAVIVKGGRVLSIGYNKTKNHPDIIEVEKIKEFCSVHAELDAIKKLKKSAKGSTIYVARIGRKGKARMSRPCNRCYKHIEDAGIKKIVYTD